MTYNLQRAKLSAILLALPFVYLAQVYPFIHFHHTHGEGTFEIIANIHPVDHPIENHADHEAGDHGHNAPDHITGDWDYTKISPRQAFIQPLNFNPSTAGVTLDESSTPFLVRSIDHRPSPRPVFISPDLPRGPPQLV